MEFEQTTLSVLWCQWHCFTAHSKNHLPWLHGIVKRSSNVHLSRYSW